MKNKIRLSAAYFTPPLFDLSRYQDDLYSKESKIKVIDRSVSIYFPPKTYPFSKDGSGPIEYESLQISSDLIALLEDWDSRYQDTYNPNDPNSSGFSSTEEHEGHIQEGLKLSARLQEELGDEITVEYLP